MESKALTQRRRGYRLLWLIGVWTALAAVPVLADVPLLRAGNVYFVAGNVWLVNAAKQARRPTKGAAVNVADTVVTGSDGEIHLDMADGAFLAIRSNSLLEVKEYRAKGDKDDNCILKLVKGTFRSFTGWIPQMSPRGYRVESITATIGVRGTDHEPFVVLESTMGEPGTYDKVNEGITFIDHPSGLVEIAAGKAGFAPFSREGKPRLLDVIPLFFKPSMYEHLLNGRHKMVQDSLKEKLDAQRKLNERQGPQDESGKDLNQNPDTPRDKDPSTGIRNAPGITGASAVGAAGAASVLTTPSAAGAPVSGAAAGVPGATAAPTADVLAPRATGVATEAPAPATVSNPNSLTSPSGSAVQSSRSVPAAGKSQSDGAVGPKDSAEAKNSTAPLSDSATPGSTSPAQAAPVENERIRIYNERRKQRQLDYREQLRREREAERQRALGTSRDADRIEPQK